MDRRIIDPVALHVLTPLGFGANAARSRRFGLANREYAAQRVPMRQVSLTMRYIHGDHSAHFHSARRLTKGSYHDIAACAIFRVASVGPSNLHDNFGVPSARFSTVDSILEKYVSTPPRFGF